MNNNKKPAVVFLHGLWGSTLDWSILIAELQRQGFAWEALCLPLFGHRSRPNDVGYPATIPGNRLTLEEIVEYFEYQMDLVEERHEVKLIVAHSYAARVVAEYLLRRTNSPLRVLMVCPFIERSQLRPAVRWLTERGLLVTQRKLLRRLPRVLSRPLLAGPYLSLSYPTGVDPWHVATDLVDSDPRVDLLPGALTEFQRSNVRREHSIRIIYTADDPLLSPAAMPYVSAALSSLGQLAEPILLPVMGAGHNPALFAPEHVTSYVLKSLKQ